MFKKKITIGTILKNVVGILFIVLVILGILYIFEIEVWPYTLLNTFLKKEKPTQEEIIVKCLTVDCPTDIAVYGQELKNTAGFPIRKINNLSFDELGNDDSYFHRALVISDRDDVLVLSDEDIAFIDDAINEGWMIYYLGRQYLQVFNIKYFGYEDSDTDNKSLVFGYAPLDYFENKVGFWKESYEKEALTHGIEVMEETYTLGIVGDIYLNVVFWSEALTD